MLIDDELRADGVWGLASEPGAELCARVLHAQINFAVFAPQLSLFVQKTVVHSEFHRSGASATDQRLIEAADIAQRALPAAG